MKYILLTAVIFCASQTLAIEESKVLKTFTPLFSKLVKNDNCYSPADHPNDFKFNLCYFSTSTEVKGKLSVKYTKFFNPKISEKTDLGTLVIAPGRTESSMKYIEVAYDYIQRGYNPVYVIDHRSQGFSDRTLTDKHKVHTSDFNYYVEDFSDLMNQIVLKDSSINLNRMFLISNSMGGAITALYLEEFNHPFKSSAMFGAMHKIIYPEPFNEFLAGISSKFLCINDHLKIFGLSCKGYAPGRGEKFKWEDRVFETNDLTHSLQRYTLRDELWRAYPGIQTGGVTVQWAGNAAWAGKKLRRNAGRIDIPLYVYTASEDTIVDPQGHEDFCRKAQNCQRFIIKGARHEILMETDHYRQGALNHMWSKFESL